MQEEPRKQNSGSKRGKGSCPGCGEEYACRYKPEKCSKCGYDLGGSFEPKNAKRSKKCNPDVVRVTPEIFSVKTSKKDDRCFVVREGNNNICLHKYCKELRATYSATGSLQTFKCKHVNDIDTFPSANPLNVYFLNEEIILNYLGDSSAKKTLSDLLDIIPTDHPSVSRVTDSSYVVFGRPSATNTVGYCHVQVISDVNRVYKCTSKSCRSFVSKTKQEKTRSTCQHLHLLYCLLHGNNRRIEESSTTLTGQNEHPETIVSQTASFSRQTTLDVAMNSSLPYKIPSSLLQEISRRDATTFLNINIDAATGWPNAFEPIEVICVQCQSPLSTARQHPGQSRDESAYLLTELNPFKRVKLLVKVCSNSLCKAMHRPRTLETGRNTLPFIFYFMMHPWQHMSYSNGLSYNISRFQSKLKNT